MADFTTLKIKPPAMDQESQDADMVVKLSHIELEQKRLVVLERATYAMLLGTFLSATFLLILSIVLAVSLQQLRASMDLIAESVGPTVVASMVAKVQGSLDNTLGSTSNVLALTENVETMGNQLLFATNQSIALLAKANVMTSSLMQHPTMQLSLGGGGGLGA